MIYYRNNLILGAIVAFFKMIGKAVYSVISFLNLQYALLVVIAGFIVFLTGAMNIYSPIKYTFIVLLCVAVLFGIFLTLHKARKKILKHSERGSNIITNQENSTINEQQKEEQKTIQTVEEVKPAVEEKKKSYPKYFTVKQNHNYFFVEYEDRYELYKRQNGTNIKVRTDYKK